MLAAGADADTLVRAAAANQKAWLARVAEAAGGVVHREPGVTWMASPAGAVLAFPRMSRDRLDALLPRFLETAEATPEASCWSLLPTRPRELGERLRAAGFREGWQAQWMAVTIDAAPAVREPAGVRIAVDPQEWSPTDLPWDGAGIAAVRKRLAASRPRRVWHIAAWEQDAPVGHATVSVTTGRLGVAGIYDMGVAAQATEARDRGRAHGRRPRDRSTGGLLGRHAQRDARRRAALPAARLPARRCGADVVALTD